MIDADITLNGIDPEGTLPPDELIYDGESERVELSRTTARAKWSLRVYHAGGGHERHHYGSFEDAFGQFTAKVADTQAVKP